VVLADLDPELHGLPCGVPVGALGKQWLGRAIPWAILLGGAARMKNTRGSGEPIDVTEYDPRSLMSGSE
jgi:hypothetical protein